MYDIAIIGCGVIGSFIARELSRYNPKIAVLEAGSDVAVGASSANSGIVHAGFDAAAGTNKAKFNVLGSRMMESTAKELGVKYHKNGSFVLSFSQKEDAEIASLLQRGVNNGVDGLRLISAEEVKALEPNISPAVRGALYAPTGGIVCPYGLAIAAMGNAMDNGAALFLNFRVSGITKDRGGFTLVSDKGGKIHSRLVINCAGIYADKVAGLIGDKSFKIGARKGEYILLDRESAGFVSRTLFTVPNEKGKGVLVTPTADGNTLLGPTSVESGDREDNSATAEGLAYIREAATRLCENIPFHQTITAFTGVRAYCDRHDFILEQSGVDKRFINVAGIESPGLSASPAIGKYVAEMAADMLNAKLNLGFDPCRQAEHFFKDLSVAEKNELIKKDKAYGRIVCRCEEVTAGEILHAVRANPRPYTVDAVKRRTRAGMGRCQGGFCQPYIVDILREAYGLAYTEITKSGGNSKIFTGKTK
jgi:glycerol-3-phosphate dehydrogenase